MENRMHWRIVSQDRPLTAGESLCVWENAHICNKSTSLYRCWQIEKQRPASQHGLRENGLLSVCWLCVSKSSSRFDCYYLHNCVPAWARNDQWHNLRLLFSMLSLHFITMYTQNLLQYVIYSKYSNFVNIMVYHASRCKITSIFEVNDSN